MLAAVFTELQQEDKALAWFQQALRTDPANLATNFNFAAALMRFGRYRDAQVRLQQTLQLKPDYAEAHNNLGIVLNKQGKAPCLG